MSPNTVKEVISKTCEHFDIDIKDDKAGSTIERIIENISDGKAGVQLSYLQMYLDALYQEAPKKQTLVKR